MKRAGQILSTALLAGLPGCLPSPCSSRVSDEARAQQAALVNQAPPLAPTVDIGVRDLADWSALPRLRDDRYQQFSSHNRAPGATPLEPGGKDFNNFIALSGPAQPLLLAAVDDPDPADAQLGGYVLAAVDEGPGYVPRMFFTCFEAIDLLRGEGFFTAPGLGRFENEVLRIYVDDLTAPAFVIPLADMGAAPPFAWPLAGRLSTALISYTPVSFSSRLRVVLDNLCPLKGYFYQVNVKRTQAATRAFSPRLAADPDYTRAGRLLAVPGQNPNTGFMTPVDDEAHELPAGAAATVFSAGGVGTIEALRFSFDDSAAARLRAVQLLIFFDAAAEPAVDVPLDAFFGCREQIASFQTLPLAVQRDGCRLEAACFLPMPFASAVRVALRNDGPAAVSLRLTVGVDRGLPQPPWGYLHARFHEVSGPQPPGSQHEVLTVTGRGRYVGTFLFAAGNTDPRPTEIGASLNILEGNETMLIDGEARVPGTGTEDYYNGGFYFAGGPFSSPFAAANFVKGGLHNDPGIVSCCRWHVLADAIDFQRSFELRFQYGSDYPALVVRYATVAYYYLDRP